MSTSTVATSTESPMAPATSPEPPSSAATHTLPAPQGFASAGNPVTIAIDAMGGDYAPAEIVKGAIEGAILHRVQVLLVGQTHAIERELAKLPAHKLQAAQYRIIDAPDVIEMGESPLSAMRHKKQSSIAVTARCVKEGQAQGMVAAGSTGAAMAAATLIVGRLKGLDRPAIGVVLPSTSEKQCLLIDGGANAWCEPALLHQFAHIGAAYMQNVYGAPNPSVGLLNIGEELGKGNPLVNEAYTLLANDTRLNFYGNVEGKDLFKGTTHVAVTDGFSGNVALKSAEGMAKLITSHLKASINTSWRAKLGALLLKPSLDSLKAKIDPHEHGGALLLGINGICIISHGSSNAWAVVNAIRQAKQAVVSHVVDKMSAAILPAPLPTA